MFVNSTTSTQSLDQGQIMENVDIRVMDHGAPLRLNNILTDVKNENYDITTV